MSALSAVEAPVATGLPAPDAGGTGSARSPRRLVIAGRVVTSDRAGGAVGAREPRSSSISGGSAGGGSAGRGSVSRGSAGGGSVSGGSAGGGSVSGGSVSGGSAGGGSVSRGSAGGGSVSRGSGAGVPQHESDLGQWRSARGPSGGSAFRSSTGRSFAARTDGHPAAARTGAPLRAGARPAAVSDRGARLAQAERSPLRLTRRGKAVLAVLLVTGLTVLALLVTTLVSSGAQATNHGAPDAGYRGMREVVVRPGQTLWSIASAAEPTADPRIVIQEIMTANALTSTDVTAGQLLWVPR